MLGRRPRLPQVLAGSSPQLGSFRAATRASRGVRYAPAERCTTCFTSGWQAWPAGDGAIVRHRAPYTFGSHVVAGLSLRQIV
jgi:hypothetical protein